MILSNAIHEATSGMLQSQSKIQQAAQDIVRSGIATDGSQQNAGATGAVPVSNAGTSVADLPASATVEATQPSLRAAVNEHRGDDLVGPVVEQMQQRLIFDASANIVQAANQALGTLIDDIS